MMRCATEDLSKEGKANLIWCNVMMSSVWLFQDHGAKDWILDSTQVSKINEKSLVLIMNQNMIILLGFGDFKYEHLAIGEDCNVGTRIRWFKIDCLFFTVITK